MSRAPKKPPAKKPAPKPAPRAGFSPEDHAVIEALASHLTVDQIADHFGIARSTFMDRKAKDPEAQRRYDMGRARALDAVGKKLLEKAKEGNLAAMIFYLKAQGGWRETNAVEVTNPDGSMTPKAPAIDLSKLSDGALAEILAATDAQKPNPSGA